ncbi:hypothetical protein X777_00791 [Ooceraea biroi]|uniref:Uncharacterized protein n=1 Tax=Ooceraea biroi TaxID=2015173 RepID=A0A026WPV2_OOCBI|nr:hypothetical protein X777_00791 [Ooceraea biroi]
MSHIKNVRRCSGTLEMFPHSRVFDTTYVFVVGDWFVPSIWRERLFLVVMQRHLEDSFFRLWKDIR